METATNSKNTEKDEQNSNETNNDTNKSHNEVMKESIKNEGNTSSSSCNSIGVPHGKSVYSFANLKNQNTCFKSIRYYTQRIEKKLSDKHLIANYVKKRLPVLAWLPKYKFKSYLMHDLASGFTVGVMNLPQG
jgi:hypothetical protein